MPPAKFCVAERVSSVFSVVPPIKDRNVVSTWFFFFVPILEGIPVIGTLFMLVWAFTGDNRSRQNYCKARLLWQLIVLILCSMVVTAGILPLLLKQAGYTRTLPVQSMHRAKHKSSEE